jgi:hypothetical protein
MTTDLNVPKLSNKKKTSKKKTYFVAGILKATEEKIRIPYSSGRYGSADPNPYERSRTGLSEIRL